MQQPELIAGPYRAPVCRADDWLDDEIDGLLQVGGWTDAPISWPRRKKTGRHSPILCGDLVRAVKTESSEAIQYWWGVGPVTVAKWRKALGVQNDNRGTRRLRQERTGVPPQDAARGRSKAMEPESVAKMAATKRGVPAHPNTAAALLRAAKRRKKPGWGTRANARMLGRDLPETHSGEWTAAEDAYLAAHYGTRHIKAIAIALGRTQESIKVRARTSGLRRSRGRWTTQDDGYLRANYGSSGPAACAAHLDRSINATYARAALLGVSTMRDVSRGRVIGGLRRWLQPDDDVLRSQYGRVSVEQLASQLGRTVSAVRGRASVLSLTKSPHRHDLSEQV